MKRIIHLLICAWLLCGCTANNTPLSTPEENTLSKTVLPMIEPTVAPTPTATAQATHTPLPRMENIPFDSQLIPLCSSGGKKESIEKLGLPGVLVYSKNVIEGLYTMGGTPLKYGEIPVDQSKDYGAFGFSQDGNWFAYSVFRSGFHQNPVIVLISASGEKVEQKLNMEPLKNTISYGNEWQGFINSFSHWVGNDLVFGFLLAQDPNSARHYPSYIEVIFDPFNGEWQEYNLENDPFIGEQPHVSPDRTRILAMERDGIHLVDLETKKDLISTIDIGAPDYSIISWANDSQHAAFLARGVYFARNNQDTDSYSQLILFSRDGKVKKLFDLLEKPDSLKPYSINWSPDGRFLSITIWENNTLKLLIYDVVQNQFSQQCPIYSIGFDGYISQIWSPDAKYIAIGGNIGIPMTIIRVDTGEKYEFEKNGYPVGWSDQFPLNWKEKK